MNTSLDYPCGPVPLDSSFYIPRPPIEEQGFQEIIKPGAVIRIKAPKATGKSSLMLRIVNYAENLGYQIATIDFQQFDRDCLNNLDRFLRSFCLQVTKQLNIEPDLDEYWDEDIGSKVSCSLYFRWYLLEKLDRPLVLVLNEVNELFEYPTLTQDFLPLLRSWYEEGKQVATWQKLRLIVVYSTEIYVPLKITQSPFNIGLPLTLPEFTLEQVEELAQLHKLDWTPEKTEQLMAMVGGHPLLVRLALYHLSNSQDETLENLLKSAASDRGIYQTHLQRILRTLKEDHKLKMAFRALIIANKPLDLQSNISYKLESMGLIKIKEDKIQVGCELYRLYFRRRFKLESEQNKLNELKNTNVADLEQENANLKTMCQLDEVTQLKKPSYFKNKLLQEWQLLSDASLPLSLIVSEVDFFKMYNDHYGSKQGNICLRRVAGAFCEAIEDEAIQIYRYEGAKFMVFLPKFDTQKAVAIAESIRTKVKSLKLEFQIPDYFCFPESMVTVTLGLATVIPSSSINPEDFLLETEKAVKYARKFGGDYLHVSEKTNYVK